MIDPVDGTTNLVHSLPYLAICICRFDRSLNLPIQAAVFNPAADELFLAQRGSGATLNSQEISATSTQELKDSLFVFNKAYNSYTELTELTNSLGDEIITAKHVWFYQP